MNQSIIACGEKVDIDAPVVLWEMQGGYACPNKRGRAACSQHDTALNDQPTQPDSHYQIHEPRTAYDELKKTVYQLILHYDVCYCSHQCHQVLQQSPFKGSHFYLDVDGTLYQTCDLYWKTNTAPADDRQGNERSVHVEMANLSWEARKAEAEIYPITRDQYRKKGDRWELMLPETYKEKIRTSNFRPYAARAYGKRGYFSRNINGKTVRMWDFTEEQYQTLIRLCIGINRLLPKIKLQVPFDEAKKKIPLGKISHFSRFAGVLGHAHVQQGTTTGITAKYDPGSAFNWNRLHRALQKEEIRRKKISSRPKPVVG